MGIEGVFLNIIKAIYERPIGNIILSRQKLKTFSLRSGKIKGCLFSPLSFNVILEVLATEIRQEKEIKGIQTGMEEVKLFAEYLIMYIEKPIVSIKKVLNLKSEFGKIV